MTSNSHQLVRSSSYSTSCSCILPTHTVRAADPCPVEPDLTAARPVVHVHVPSFCECGATVVGVWYNKKPYYCQWFRHKRYAALRKLLEQNRCKSKNVSDRWKLTKGIPTSSAPCSEAIQQGVSVSSSEAVRPATGVEIVQHGSKCFVGSTDASDRHNELASGSSCPVTPGTDRSGKDEAGIYDAPRHQCPSVHHFSIHFFTRPVSLLK